MNITKHPFGVICNNHTQLDNHEIMCNTGTVHYYSIGGAMSQTADQAPVESINYHNVAKVLSKILTRWGVSQKDAAALVGVSLTQFSRLKDKQGKISQDNEKRMAYLLNIHEQLTFIFGDEENRKIFITTPNQAPLFNSKTPLAFMLEEGLIGIYQTYTHLASMRGAGW